MSNRRQRYPQEIRERAIRLVAEVREEYDSEWAAIESVATKLGIGSTETLRKWIRKAEVDAGHRRGVTSEESAEVRRLRAEVRELRAVRRRQPDAPCILVTAERPRSLGRHPLALGCPQFASLSLET
jgi:transposase